MSEHVCDLAYRMAVEIAEDGAWALVLLGSHACGDAGPNSYLDLLAVGDEWYMPRPDVSDDACPPFLPFTGASSMTPRTASGISSLA